MTIFQILALLGTVFNERKMEKSAVAIDNIIQLAISVRFNILLIKLFNDY